MKTTRRLRIYIEGNIGAGKSTLISSLCNCLSGKYKTYVGAEPVGDWLKDGLLQCYYEDPKRYAFVFQMNAMAGRIKRDNELALHDYDIVINERSYFGDHIFAQAQRQQGHMSEQEMACYERMLDAWRGKFFPVTDEIMFIYLSTNPETCFRNMQQRSRTGESKITLDYLQLLHELHQRRFVQNAADDPLLKGTVVFNFEQMWINTKTEIMNTIEAKIGEQVI